jgi:hypothetical protein
MDLNIIKWTMISMIESRSSHFKPRIPSETPAFFGTFRSCQDLLPVLLQNLLLGSWSAQMVRLASREISLLTMLRLGTEGAGRG